jgi:hypothetical protein
MATEEELYAQYEQELAMAQQQNQNSGGSQYQQMYSGVQKQNLVEWELDFQPELLEIGRSLRCDIIVTDRDGNQKWITNPDRSRVFLNELGVNDVLRRIFLLVNKNKVLSNYTIDEIKLRVRMIGHELRALIYNNYEQYGIDNEYKMNNYSSMVLDILDIIEGAYRRALAGETHKGLNEQRLVTQNEQVSPQVNYSMVAQPQRKAKWYNPTTWTA